MIKKNKNLLDNAKQLRKEMTKQERHLWYDFLKDYPIKIYKQRIIGNYIVDFYCHKAKLVIEIDGSQHYTENGELYDKIRTQSLNDIGLTVMRFTNLDVDGNFEGVCIMIDEYIKSNYNCPSQSPDGDSSP